MDVSVIIVNYNTENLTIQAINSVEANSKQIEYEIIVVDNASPDGIAKLSSMKSDYLRVIPLDENLGFGRANNEGLKYANGRNVFFLNPDTELRNNVLKILSEYLDAHPNVATCGGNLFDEDGVPTHSFSRLYPSILKDLDFIFCRFYTKLRYGENAEHNHTETPINVAYICGADMMARKSLLDKYGAFDTDYFLYHEECDMAYRLTKLGYEHHSVPSAMTFHYEGKSFDFSSKREAFSFDGKMTYYRKHFSKNYVWMSCMINIVFLKIATISCFLTKKTNAEKYSFRLNLYKKHIENLSND